MGEQAGDDSGCDGRVAAVSASVAVFGTHLQLRGHKQAATCRKQKIPDHGEDMEKSHDQCQGKSSGERNNIFSLNTFCII